MLQYLIILLDDTSTSYCHYENLRKKNNLIPLDALKAGIRFGMVENLMIQFVYPDYELPQEYKDAIEAIDHSKIVSSQCEDASLKEEADVIVCHNWADMKCDEIRPDKSFVLRTTKADLIEKHMFLKDILSKMARLNIVITDVEKFTDEDIEKYKEVLHTLAEHIETLYADGKSPQLNLLTDRMMLKEMNNCGAGDTNITLAPNGKFYVCPAFYYDDGADCIGDLEHGLDIKNKQLYKLQYAPICRHCDAWQCKRCIWLNRKTTLEVNTPSHEQCVVAHLERNASRLLQQKLEEKGIRLNPSYEIKEIDYLDPFIIVNKWK